MISILGQLAIRTISGRNGPFNVGKLVTSIGEFVIKDSQLDQYTEGKYDGTFAVSQIRPSYYTHGGRLVVEIRAELGGMTLEDVSDLSVDEVAQMSSTVADPLDEEKPSSLAEQRQPSKRRTPVAGPPPQDDTPFGMSPSSPAPAANDSSADAELFGTVWPLGAEVKLDTTVDRQRLRAQSNRLNELGYHMDFKRQLWERPSG